MLLYELLTGRTPLESAKLRKAGIEAALRAIREEEAPKPSKKISALDESTRIAIAEVRQVPPAKLTQNLRRDLDWIVMKALEKERDRRYETATAFAEDLRRYCADETVSASPPSLSYRFRKFTKRNRILVGSSVAVAFSLITGLGVSLHQAKLATEQSERANQVSKELREESGKSSWLSAARNATETLRSEEGKGFVAPVFPDMSIMAAKAFGFAGYGRPPQEEIERLPQSEREFWELKHSRLLDPNVHLAELAEARNLIQGGFEGVVPRYRGERLAVHSFPFEPIWSSAPPPFSPVIERMQFVDEGAQLFMQRASWPQEQPPYLSLWDLETGKLLKSVELLPVVSFDTDESRSLIVVLHESSWYVWSFDDWPLLPPIARHSISSRTRILVKTR